MPSLQPPRQVSRHAVRFYDSDDELVGQVLQFLAPAPGQREALVVLAAPHHLPALRAGLAGLADGRSVTVLDAAETLSRFLVGGRPDEALFEKEVGALVRRLCSEHGGVRAFGEMVALLCERGDGEAAIVLEGLWNRLLSQLPASILCAYPMRLFRSPGAQALFHDLCDGHLDVLPAGSLELAPADASRRVAVLEQRLAALELRLADAEEGARGGAELEDLIENAAECMHQVDADGRILWANRAELILLGYRRDEYVGHPLALFHADPEVVAGMMERLERGETVVNQPARLRCRDGSLRTVLVTANARFRGGELLYTRGFTRDISDRLDLDAMRQGMQERQARRDGHHAVLARLGRACRRSLPAQALLDETASRVAASLGLEVCGAWRLEEGGAQALLVAGTGWRASAIGTTREAAGNGTLLGQAILAGEALVSDDLSTEDRFAVPRSLSGLTSGLAAPVEGPGGRTWGVLCAYTKERVNLSLDDAHFLQAAADLLGIGLVLADERGRDKAGTA